ncbi:hypothetical protein Pmar_PMAR018899 [Perkinsus marinus ATCC 50983]|uniref:Uncharacterized protein n=1 Tax=Perkinsus marinus (strain ATCC 50983 / TXsc) TaxID=423536 RepID=C5KA06_PERM5|nr:hypothetical protein Pmar_PMAR018899 [Perkinsus marinus ATCC 50983]EER18687.1 hypothetical protein Pmar_PMAR018899 [Perkinsus marinus ATCC 50983]|eukprot:XP_002786891.1 hypothetical protein Pmar_PMAR018899 [Perkinsus marinus ATCC 50983]
MMKSEGHQLSGIANSSRSDGMKEIDVQHRSTPSDGSGQHVKTDPDKHDASRSSQGETEKEDPTNAKPVFKELSLDDLVAPPGPACVLDDPKLKAAYDYCDTTTAAVIDVAIRQATALCERGIEEQFEVAEAELRVALIEAEMEAYK